jgi:serine/threonine protein kinase
MELCDEGSVTDLIATHKTLSEDMIKPIAKSVLGGLAYMHNVRETRATHTANNSQ